MRPKFIIESQTKLLEQMENLKLEGQEKYYQVSIPLVYKKNHNP